AHSRIFPVTPAPVRRIAPSWIARHTRRIHACRSPRETAPTRSGSVQAEPPKRSRSQCNTFDRRVLAPRKSKRGRRSTERSVRELLADHWRGLLEPAVSLADDF